MPGVQPRFSLTVSIRSQESLVFRSPHLLVTAVQNFSLVRLYYWLENCLLDIICMWKGN